MTPHPPPPPKKITSVPFPRSYIEAGERLMQEQANPLPQPGQVCVLPRSVWKKMTPEEYVENYEGFGRHVAIVHEEGEGCYLVWVLLGKPINFLEVDDPNAVRLYPSPDAERVRELERYEMTNTEPEWSCWERFSMVADPHGEYVKLADVLALFSPTPAKGA